MITLKRSMWLCFMLVCFSCAPPPKPNSQVVTGNMPSLGSFARYAQLIEEGRTGSENIFPEHYAFLSRDIPNIEGLANLESLIGEEEIVFVGFPLKIKDGNGAPLRAAALVY